MPRDTRQTDAKYIQCASVDQSPVHHALYSLNWGFCVVKYQFHTTTCLCYTEIALLHPRLFLKQGKQCSSVCSGDSQRGLWSCGASACDNLNSGLTREDKTSKEDEHACKSTGWMPCNSTSSSFAIIKILNKIKQILKLQRHWACVWPITTVGGRSQTQDLLIASPAS